MAQISSFLFARHLRAQANEHVVHFRKGVPSRSGRGLAYWFFPLSAAVAQVPVEDLQTTFVLQERSADFQPLRAQVTVIYRIVDPRKAVNRVNFAISLSTGAWTEQPLEKLAVLWSNWSLEPARSVITGLSISEAVRSGAETVRGAMESALREKQEIAEIGLGLVSVRVEPLAPSAELEKALQTPTREAIQQKADEATFQRRALAVEKERAIKENELLTQIELSRQQQELIRQEGANALLGVEQEAERQRLATEAELARAKRLAESSASDLLVKTEAQARANRLLGEVEQENEKVRVETWRDAPSHLAIGLAAQLFAEKIQSVERVSLTPDQLGDLLRDALQPKRS
ncbi:MAG: SPFH domain-containing protein [Thermoanaerobaculia bacterium]